MARSYKHSPINTDGSRRSTKNTKRKANRIVRRYNKHITNGFLKNDIRFSDSKTLDGKSYRKYFQSYNIHDWINYWDKKQALKSYHKYDFWKRDYKTEEEFLNKYWKKICFRK